ncbi:MAG: DUF2269 family protein [Nocardiopsaceae bacterium]|nr:DUF2269 family protein [Nocardiopsaceae bacterium]
MLKTITWPVRSSGRTDSRTERADTRKRPATRRLPPWLRRTLIAAHVTSSLMWFGLVAGVLVLCSYGWATDDPGTTHAVFRSLGLFDTLFLGTVSFAVPVTGLLLGLATPWGVIRYWWVLLKLMITLAVMVAGALVQHRAIIALDGWAKGAGAAALDGTAQAPLEPFRTLTIGTAVAVTLLVVAIVLSYAKPLGPTPWFQRGKRAPGPTEPQGNAEPAAERIPVLVTAVETVAEDTIAVTLRRDGAADLPVWSPGAHIDVALPSGRIRQYSLCGDPADPATYRIAVLREPTGRGGSEEVHNLAAPGAHLRIGRPRNAFPLRRAPAYLFIAGGIGITPILPMIEAVAAHGTPWRLVYAARNAHRMPFTDALSGRHPRHVVLVAEDTHGRPDLRSELRSLPQGAITYCCGPPGLIDAVRSVRDAVRTDVPLETESFTPAAENSAGAAFEIELQRSGELLNVPADTTALDVLREQRPHTPSSCDNGICGWCELRVIAGDPDHRGAEPGRDRFRPCVSRARGRLVVDL